MTRLVDVTASTIARMAPQSSEDGHRIVFAAIGDPGQAANQNAATGALEAEQTRAEYSHTDAANRSESE